MRSEQNGNDWHDFFKTPPRLTPAKENHMTDKCGSQITFTFCNCCPFFDILYVHDPGIVYSMFIYMYMCVCMCVILNLFAFSPVRLVCQSDLKTGGS